MIQGEVKVRYGVDVATATADSEPTGHDYIARHEDTRTAGLLEDGCDAYDSADRYPAACRMAARLAASVRA